VGLAPGIVVCVAGSVAGGVVGGVRVVAGTVGGIAGAGAGALELPVPALELLSGLLEVCRVPAPGSVGCSCRFAGAGV
jgi:hypothetical protein